MESLIFFLSGILLSTWCLCVINNLKKFVLEVRHFSRRYGVYCRVRVQYITYFRFVYCTARFQCNSSVISDEMKFLISLFITCHSFYMF